MSKSLIRKNQLHPDISDLVSGYGNAFFITQDELEQALSTYAPTIFLTGENVLYTTGDQTISGLKTFIIRPQINGTGVLLSGEAAQLPDTIVYTSGDQTISGNKNFIIRPTVSNSGILLQGEIDLSIYATSTNLASTGSTLATNLASTGSTLYPRSNPSGFISSSGSNTISGQNTFYGDKYIFSGADIIVSGGTFNLNIRPLVNNSGILLNGEAATTINLASTGSTLATNLASTGSTLATNLASTGARVNSLSGNVVFLNGNQTIGGQKTFNSNFSIIGSGTVANVSNGAVLQVSGFRVLTTNDSVTPTLPSTIVYTTGNQNITGIKTFDDDTVFANNVFMGDPNFRVPFVNAMLEIYRSGNTSTELKINNPFTGGGSGVIARSNLILATPGNNLSIYSRSNIQGYHVNFSGDSPFVRYSFNGSDTTRMYIENDGKVGIGVGTGLTSAGGILQLGGGITFPSSQVASTNVNTLDDYEEGTWIPTIKGETTAGSATYSAQNGYYIKIGRQVFVNGRITMSTNANTITGNLYIDPLPFSSDTNANSQSIIPISFFQNLAIPVVNIYGIAAVNNNRINLFKFAATGTTSNARLLPTDITNTVDFIFAGSYRSAS